MKHNVRRTEFKDRLRVSGAAAEWNQSIKYTVTMYDKWHRESLTDKSFTEGQLRAALIHAKTHVMPIEKMPILCWDPSLEYQPQLDGGQHRRQAFMDLFNADNKHTEITIENAVVRSPAQETLFHNC